MTPYYADASVTVHAGDCLDVLRALPDASVDAVCTDPPYGLANTTPQQVADTLVRWVNGDRDYIPAGRGFMGKPWDAFVPPVAVWDECLRVLKPGGHVLAFAGSRTHDLMTLGIRLAGFDIRDTIAWLSGSGFPKSLDVSKAIDKAAGAEREVVGPSLRHVSGKAEQRTDGLNGSATFAESVGMGAYITAPATPDAERWQGWGTALKPAHEPIVVARKPLAGTVAANVLAHGTGALNVDGCRVGREEGDRTEYGRGKHLPHANTTVSMGAFPEVTPYEPHAAGRWPANVILDESQARELDAMSGEGSSRRIEKPADPTPNHRVTYNGADDGSMGGARPARGHTDEGGASRFFYVAKADASERVRVNGVAHPTVKPLALMRWLVRLVTPPSGTVLEPFAGSGTTVEACILEGFRCVAIERDETYLPLIRQRIHRRRDPVEAVRGTGEDGGLFDLLNEEPA